MAQDNPGRRGRQGRGSGIFRRSSTGSASSASSPGNSSSTSQALDIRFARDLRAHRGKLDFGEGPGQSVHAASFLPRREIVFDEALLDHAPDFVNIVAHEIYHFVWRRLSNLDRKDWALLLEQEQTPLHPGLSSRLRYDAWVAKRTPRRWKDYVCEAFCDTAAGITSPNIIISPQRRRWFSHLIKKRKLPV